MTHYDYKVIPAPTRGQKAQGVKTPEARFANTVEGVLNAQAAEGWEYLRSDILPSDERQGLTGVQTVYRTLLVFRRARQSGKDAAQSPAGEVISTAQSVAETVAPEEETRRREPSLTPIQPTRGDPADPPPTPPDPASPETPNEETPGKD